jgi:hypothetical protein
MGGDGRRRTPDVWLRARLELRLIDELLDDAVLERVLLQFPHLLVLRHLHPRRLPS